MRYKLVMAAVALLPSALLAAQTPEQINEARRAYYCNYSRLTVATHVGLASVWGDFSTFSSKQFYASPLLGLGLGYQITPILGLSIEGSVGHLKAGARSDNEGDYLNFYGFQASSATDAQKGIAYARYGDLYSDISLAQGRIGVDINLMALFAGSKADRKVALTVSPSYYLQYYRPTVYRDGGERYTTRDLYYDTTNGVGGEVNLRIAATKWLDFSIKGGGVYGFNPKFDGIAGKSDANVLAYGQIGLVFKLSGKTLRDDVVYARRAKDVPVQR